MHSETHLFDLCGRAERAARDASFETEFSAAAQSMEGLILDPTDDSGDHRICFIRSFRGF